MSFLELYHVYIYYMTSYIHFCGKIPPTAVVMRRNVASQSHANKMPRFTCYYEPMLKLLNYMHMGPKNYGHCPNV